MLDAMRDVIAQHFFLEPAKRRTRRRNLRHNVDAVTVLVDHARNPAHLTLNADQAPLARVFGRRLHG
jgi:hypothetical protein